MQSNDRDMPPGQTASHTVAIILMLRRVAEQKARQQLTAALAQLEAARRLEAAAAQRLHQAEQALSQRLTQRLPVLQSAQRLCQEHSVTERLREAVRHARQDYAREVEATRTWSQQVHRMRELFRLAIARREAAELYEEARRRERSRSQARRDAALEEELASRQPQVSAERRLKGNPRGRSVFSLGPTRRPA